MFHEGEINGPCIWSVSCYPGDSASCISLLGCNIPDGDYPARSLPGQEKDGPEEAVERGLNLTQSWFWCAGALVRSKFCQT